MCRTDAGNIKVPPGTIAVPEFGYTGRHLLSAHRQHGAATPRLGRIIPDVGGGELEPDWGAVSKHIGQMVSYLRQAEM